MRNRIKRSRSRLISFLTVCVLLLTTLLPALTVSAEGSTIDTSRTGSLTIHKYDGDPIDEGDTIGEALEREDISPLADVVFSYLLVGSVGQGTNSSGAITIGYSITDAGFLSLIGENNSNLVVAFTEGGTTYYTPASLDAALDSVSKTNVESFMSTTASNVETMEETDPDGESTVSLGVGLYLIVETGTPAAVTSTTEPFLVSIPTTVSITNDDGEITGFEWEYNVHVYPKNSTRVSTIEKSVVEDGNETGYIDGEIGQDKEFVIRADVPGAIANMQKYTITDTLSEGLTFQSDITPVVRGISEDGEVTTLTSEHYSFTQNGQVLTFDFTTSAMGTGSSATYVQIEITYYAYLNEKAVVGGTGNSNSVELEYSTTTDSESDETDTVGTDSPVIYTYGIDLLKYADGVATDVLQGVTFELYSEYDVEDPSSAVKIPVAYYSDEENNTYYYYVIGNNSGTDVDITTDENGKIDLRGLESGTYYLVETGTAEGYNLLSGPITIVIESTEGQYGSDDDGTYAVYDSSIGEYYADSTASTQFILPDGVQDGDYVNFGTNLVYDEGGNLIQMYSPVALTWSVTVDGEEAISSGTLVGDGQITINVNNQSGFELPATGGTGTFWFIVGGGIIVAIALVSIYAVTRKKRSA